MNLVIIESPWISKTISITIDVLYYLRYLALPYLIESLYSIEMYKNIGIERVNTFFPMHPFFTPFLYYPEVLLNSPTLSGHIRAFGTTS